MAELYSHIKKVQRAHLAERAERRQKCTSKIPARDTKNINFFQDSYTDSMTHNRGDEQEILTRYVKKRFQHMPPPRLTNVKESCRVIKNEYVDFRDIRLSTLHARSIEQ